ncbi:universal stress protein [Runella sp.]|uniref:universal stress protein n=1 Tax=Runella sp. TaxID=1960881 RepID=UPI003D10F08D
MRTILVPTDFSENAKKALEFAQAIAERYDAGISLIHAYSPAAIDPNLPVETWVTLEDQIEKINLDLLNEWIKDCEKKGFKCTGKQVMGPASDVILDEIKAQKPILVVMGRTGKGGWLDKIMGSVASSVTVKTLCPVLVLPPDSHTKTIKRIVYATELERPEENALGFAFNFAEHFDAELTLVKVNAPFEVNVFEDEDFVNDITKKFGKKKYEFKTIEADSVIEGLQNYADKQHSDLIVMATRKRDWLAELINPSVAKKMVLDTHVPVLIYHLEQLVPSA